MEQGDQNYSQVESDAAGGANAMPARASRRSSSRTRKNRRPKTEPRKKTLHATYDHNSVGYEWLRSGWIAEEYITKSGRTYKVKYGALCAMDESSISLDQTSFVLVVVVVCDLMMRLTRHEQWTDAYMVFESKFQISPNFDVNINPFFSHFENRTKAQK